MSTVPIRRVLGDLSERQTNILRKAVAYVERMQDGDTFMNHIGDDAFMNHIGDDAYAGPKLTSRAQLPQIVTPTSKNKRGVSSR